MDKLDTGVLVCHLARRIQTIARDVVESRTDSGVDSAASSMDTHSVNEPPARSAAPLNGSAQSSPEAIRQAQQCLQMLLRSSNTAANLLAAAKVSINAANAFHKFSSPSRAPRRVSFRKRAA